MRSAVVRFFARPPSAQQPPRATAAIPSVVMAAEGAADTSKIRNFDMIEAFYREYPKKLAVVRGTLNRPLTLTEKILFTHLYHPESLREFKRGVDYIELRPDRAGTHDIGGPMAIIQFLSSGKERIALPAALVCDHLVQANVGAIPDLKVAEKGNVETYEFLRDVSRRYGFDFWPPAPASAIRSSWKTTTSRVA